MIQRIQSVYLSIGLILMGLISWLPLGEIVSGETIYKFSILGIFNELTGDKIYSGIPLMIMLGIIIIAQVFIIYGYKKRVLQMRVATFNIIFMLGFVLVSWFFVQSSLKTIGVGAYAFKIAMAFPLVTMILNFLAIRAIAKDELLVRSVDRIR
jgi:hypothetical protein